MSETLKEKNYALVEKVVTSPWWEPKYAELLDPNMTLELPLLLPVCVRIWDADSCGPTRPG